ncbi:hypothetical protein QNI16_15325 [Cytophagaceae bacterium YF14B1]|uniref:Uncharacterized protein n=1 Tax=Xanthocytophaga flava TaxID=3048013 RepID=A0AAE3QRJ4_9BACT|nr:hypothetical protein [Xanthocytophaga flavus]MDJ1481871.1 hypothetical protein [Xanthocytophaga flavus]
MATNIRNNYKGGVISIDNNEFIECIFEDCLIEYGGLGPITLQGCQFVNCNWRLVGPAQNTMLFLSSMYNGFGDFGKQMVDGLFAEIRKKDSKVLQ